MRIGINIKALRLPIIYRHRLMALIKEALKESDSSYKDLLYPDKSAAHSKKTKPFSFSLYIPPEHTKKKERFLLDDGVVLEDTVFYPADGREFSLFISSSDYQFMINLYNGLLKIKEFELMEFPSPDGSKEKEYLQIGKVFMLNERKIDSDEVVFKTMSYISVEDDNDRPIELFKQPEQPKQTERLERLERLEQLKRLERLERFKRLERLEHPHHAPVIDNDQLERFNHHLNAIQDRILKDLRGYGLKKPLEFLPINMKKKGVKHTLKAFREQTGKPYMVLTTYQGTFCLRGDPEDLQLLYQTGIGLRTGQGFGMVDII